MFVRLCVCVVSVCARVSVCQFPSVFVHWFVRLCLCVCVFLCDFFCVFCRVNVCFECLCVCVCVCVFVFLSAFGCF